MSTISHRATPIAAPVNAPPMQESVTCIVTDTGTGHIKGGLGGEDAPRTHLATCLGWPRHPGVSGRMLANTKDNFTNIGAAERGLLAITNPMTRGIVNNWIEMERLWHQLYYTEMRMCPEEHPMLITESAQNPRSDRQKAAEIMFEVFNVPALVVSNQSVLALYAVGRCTGVVVDSGEGCTNVVPIYEGYSLPHYVKSLPIAGQDLTTHLFNLLRREGYDFSTAADRSHLEEIKSTLCYVSRDAKSEQEYSQQSVSLERMYTMPDGAQILLNATRFMCPEALFQPSLMGLEGQAGIHQVCQASVSMCDSDTQTALYQNIVLAGGNTLFPKVDERLQQELQSMTASSVKVVGFPERRYASWIGGSIVASLNTFPCMWVSKNEYDDYGSSVIHRKCLN